MNPVALFRNLNFGHPGSPTSAELVEAFGDPAAARAGADSKCCRGRCQ